MEEGGLASGCGCAQWLSHLPRAAPGFSGSSLLVLQHLIMIWGYQGALGVSAQGPTEPTVPIPPAAGMGRMERGGM